jgi:hypothetical protein
MNVLSQSSRLKSKPSKEQELYVDSFIQMYASKCKILFSMPCWFSQGTFSGVCLTQVLSVWLAVRPWGWNSILHQNDHWTSNITWHHMPEDSFQTGQDLYVVEEYVVHWTLFAVIIELVTPWVHIFCKYFLMCLACHGVFTWLRKSSVGCFKALHVWTC